VPKPDSTGGGQPQISFEPSADASAVSGVVRVRVESPSLGAGDIALFQGTLSSYYIARIKSGELPETLAARQIPAVSWRADGGLLLAPVRPLAPGEYSLSSSSGLVGQFQVATAQPLLTRLWPPASASGELSHVIYCGDGSAPLPLDALSFEPGELSITPLPGADAAGLFSDRCLHIDSDMALAPDQIVMPPPAIGAWALDPAPFSGAAAEPAATLSCKAEELALGPGCGEVEDDRVVVHTPEAALLWVMHSEHGSFLEVTQANAPFVLRGLVPGGTEHLWGSVYDLSGAQSDFDWVVTMHVARERPVLSEVLANALGPEPQSEWIEIVNDGVLVLDLSHFAVRDGGGSRALPAATLAAQEYVLLVRQDFAPSASDVPPAAGARLIRVPELGTAGLANSGENLALIDADSSVISSLPAVATKAGQSLARRHSFSPDDDPNAFTTGTPTPGAPND
jgi:hypothetical protein